MAEIARFHEAFPSGQDGLFFSVNVTVPGHRAPDASTLEINGSVAHETAEVTGLRLYSTATDIVREIPFRGDDQDAGDGGAPEVRARPRDYHIEVSLLELAQGVDVHLEAHLRRADGRTSTTRLGTLTDLPAAELDLRYREMVAPLIVGSTGRSGTTLLMALLSEHPAIVVPGPHPFEYREMTYLWHAVRVLTAPAGNFEPVWTPESALRNQSAVGFDPYNRTGFHEHVAAPRVRRWRQRELPAQLIDFTKQQVDTFAALNAPGSHAGKPRYLAEKMSPTPMIHFISNVHPSARRIFLVRDFRDTFCSARAFNRKRGTQEFGASLFATELDWLRHMGTGSRRMWRYYEAYRDTSLLVRYEDLVTGMDAEVARILDHLELDADAATVSRVIERGVARGMPEHHGTAAHPRESVGRWRRDLTDDERETALAFRELLDAQGYGERGYRVRRAAAGVATVSGRARATDGDAPASTGDGSGDPRRPTETDPIQESAMRSRPTRGPADRSTTTATRPSRPVRADRPIGEALRHPLKAIRTLRQLRASGIVVRVDQPRPDSIVSTVIPLHVTGWAFSRHRPIERVEILVDGRPIAEAELGTDRADVGNAYPGVASARKSGFHRWLTIGKIEPGPHELEVRATDQKGRSEVDRRRIMVRPPSSSAASDGDGVAPAAVAVAPAAVAVAPAAVAVEPALLFIHIPKTAGTSLRKLLEPLVPQEERVYLYRNTPGMALSDEEFRQLPMEEKERLRLIFGHFHYGVHKSLPGPARYVTMLRDPVDRVISQYYHHKTYPKSAHHKRIAGGGVTLQQFIDEGTLAVDNQMVRQLSGLRKVRFGDCDDEMLQVAMDNIDRHFAAVLIMEEMEASVRILGELVGKPLKKAPELNRNKARPKREAIDPALRERIATLNRFDVALYQNARKLFDARLAEAADVAPRDLERAV